MHDDDIAFQRAILANPADVTLKLVYADWLQDRADPRAAFVRLQVQLGAMTDPSSHGQIPEALAASGAGLDPTWVAFMTTLAQPFVPIRFQPDENGHPFPEPIGHRGRIVTFESQYRSADDWSKELLADLSFLTSVEWGVCNAEFNPAPLSGFVCYFPSTVLEPEDEDVQLALQVERQRLDWMTDLFEDQFLFARDVPEAEKQKPYSDLLGYAAQQRLWHVWLRLRGPLSDLADRRYYIGFALGRSPSGNRLIGAHAYQSFHHE